MTDDNKKYVPMRMDLISETESFTENEDGLKSFTVRLIPDPNRYRCFKEGDETYYEDKFTGLIIPFKVMAKALPQLAGMPIFYSAPKCDDYATYIESERIALLNNWEQKYTSPPVRRAIDEYLRGKIGEETRFVILYVDMAGSTKISSAVDSATYVKINKIFLMQMSKIIDNFNGYVLKYVGDCVIGIFPAVGNCNGMCDNAIQSAMFMVGIIDDVINKIFEEKGFPSIGCHIGIDVGEVCVDTIGTLDIGSFTDLIGYPMNLTAKIQAMAGHNDIVVGKWFFETLHCSWQKYAVRLDTPDFTLKDPYTDDQYEVYRYLGRYELKK